MDYLDDDEIMGRFEAFQWLTRVIPASPKLRFFLYSVNLPGEWRGFSFSFIKRLLLLMTIKIDSIKL